MSLAPESSYGTTESIYRPAEVLKLDQNEYADIDAGRHFLDYSEVYEQFKINGRVLAKVKAVGETFSVLDVSQEPTFDVDYALFDESYAPSAHYSHGCLVILPGRPNLVGAAYSGDQFKHSPKFSDRQFRFSYYGTSLRLISENPTTPTYLFMPSSSSFTVDQDKFQDDRTIEAQIRIARQGTYDIPDMDSPHGYYLGLPLLGRYSDRIDQGVYVGGNKREAIFVDGSSPALMDSFEQLTSVLMAAKKIGRLVNHKLSNEATLKFVNLQVRRTLPYKEVKTHEISNHYYDDKLVKLSNYVINRAGVCRHQALLAAYMIEKLTEHELLYGLAGIERNDGSIGAHSWATYKEVDHTYVIDPTSNFVGTKKQARDRSIWKYDLSTD